MGICFTRMADCSGVALFNGQMPRILSIQPWINDEFFASVVYRLDRSANDN